MFFCTSVSTCFAGTDFDTMLHLERDTCGGSCISWNIGNCSESFGGIFSFLSEEYAVYFLSISGSSSSVGTFVLSVSDEFYVPVTTPAPTALPTEDPNPPTIVSPTEDPFLENSGDNFEDPVLENTGDNPVFASSSVEGRNALLPTAISVSNFLYT